MKPLFRDFRPCDDSLTNVSLLALWGSRDGLMARHGHRRDRGAYWLVLVMTVHIPSLNSSNQSAECIFLSSRALTKIPLAVLSEAVFSSPQRLDTTTITLSPSPTIWPDEYQASPVPRSMTGSNTAFQRENIPLIKGVRLAAVELNP